MMDALASTKLAVLLLLATTLLAGCMMCGDGRLDVASGTLPVVAGEQIELRFFYNGDYLAGPERCDALWDVDGIRGGDEAVGTITECGLYTAPATAPPAGRVEIKVATYESGTCADCCPFAVRTIAVVDAAPGG